MGARRRHSSRIPAKRQSLDEGGKWLADHFQSRGRKNESQDPSPLLLTKMLYNRDTETGLACNLQYGSSDSGGLLFRGASLQNSCRSLFSQMEERKIRTSTELGRTQKRAGSQYMFSPIPKHFFVSIFAVWCMLQSTHQSRGRAQGAFIPKGAAAERCIMVMCLLGRSRYRGLRDKMTKERNEESYISDRSKRLLGTLGLRMLGGAKKERFLCSRDVNGAQLRR